MTPASVIKLLTAYAGVLGLGFDYRWETKFFIVDFKIALYIWKFS